MKTFVVIDMQQDFISGSLGSEEARQIVPRVAERIRSARREGRTVLFTLDTHGPDYLRTQEGKNLPVAHCLRGTPGWELDPALVEALEGEAPQTFEKGTFGSAALARELQRQAPEEIELAGVCTDICVISNALLLKAFLPETPIRVNAACCAGVTPERHRTALEAMRACQITCFGE